MKSTVFANLANFFAPIIMVLAMLLTPATGGVRTAYASPSSAPNSCGQLLADAEAQFLSTLASDGSVPVTPETQAAALEYIRVSKLCYEEIEKQNSANTLQEETPSFIDDGGVTLEGVSSSEFVLTNAKWGSRTQGTAGGTITYSFMGNGLSLSAEGSGTSGAITSLPGFKPCFLTEIQNSFAAWQAVSNIKFVQVSDSGAAFDAPGATGDIRIGSHAFDGVSGVLAHAYYPPPNGYSAAGDVHFDIAENWSCDTSGTDIGIVALHEIGHSLGLGHENTSKVAVMDPYYNSSLTSLQSDDIDGSLAIYGAVNLADAPINDDFSVAKAVGSVPYSDTLDTTGANPVSDNPAATVSCDGKVLRNGTKNVWYHYKSLTTRPVSFDTMGSNYDAYIAVWTGSNVNSLSLVGCNDDNDTNTGLQAQFTFTAQAGVQYYIEVAQYNGEISGSPSPATGGTLKFHATTFRDVPGDYWAWRWIEGLYSAGVTGGCGGGIYCPGSPVTRDQMAVFLLKGKHGSGYTPPAVGGTTGFSDVPTNHWAAAWIKQLAAEGITGGCGGGRYCPGTAVTRDQMAIFLLKARHGTSYSPPPPSGVFLDVPTNHWAASWIEQLAAEGITGGCGNGNYCPGTPVTRDQMAVFLLRTFNIPPKP